MSWVRIDVDLDEVYGEMSRTDKRDMAEWLHDDGILESHPNPEIRKVVRGDDESYAEKELRDNLTKLWNGHYQLPTKTKRLLNKLQTNYNG